MHENEILVHNLSRLDFFRNETFRTGDRVVAVSSGG